MDQELRVLEAGALLSAFNFNVQRATSRERLDREKTR
jgi:hypothetical protein